MLCMIARIDSSNNISLAHQQLLLNDIENNENRYE